MDDLGLLATQAAQALGPWLPHLIRGAQFVAEKAAGKLSEKAGEAAWEQARALWARLRNHERVAQVAEAAAAVPDNAALRQALAEEIARALREDAALRADLARLLGAPTGSIVAATGDRAVAVGGEVRDSVIITGDANTVGTSASPRGRTLVVVQSSMIHAVGYDPRTRRLEVVFNSGRVYCYEEVPPEVYEELLAAESKGRYMRDAIIDVYPFTYGPCPPGE